MAAHNLSVQQEALELYKRRKNLYKKYKGNIAQKILDLGERIVNFSKGTMK